MTTKMNIKSLRFEQNESGFGIHLSTPRLSWTVDGPIKHANWYQQSYEIQVKRNGISVPKTFSAHNSNTLLVPWPDAPLESREIASVRVRSLGMSVCGQADTNWSEWHTVEASLLYESDWIANAISSPLGLDGTAPGESSLRPMRFRKIIRLNTEATRARLYITALGLYEAYLNEQRVGNELLLPGWTSYEFRIQFQVFDITSLLIAGDNTLVVDVAEGWYAGRLLWGEGNSRIYGDRIGPLVQLEIFDSDKSKMPSICVVTDDTWQYKPSAVTGSGIYDGETYNLGLEFDPWNASNVDWAPVEVLCSFNDRLVPSSCEPIRVTEVVSPVSITKDPDGKVIVDFGQNLVGRIRVPFLSKPNGYKLVFRYAEVLENGRLGTRPLRAAKATDTIIFGGDRPLRDWAPRFTYHGFRYLEVDGWGTEDDEPLTFESLTAEVMHTDMKRTGYFSCSDERVNQLHENAVWSMRGNFVGLPTDCPQRDERLGWTGDIQVFGPAASYIYGCAGMLANWMQDLILEQRYSGGIVPLVVPNVMKKGPWPTVPQAVWDDIIIILPWTLYLNFGDIKVLRDSWAGMKNYLRTIQRGQDGLWDPELWQLGDWLDPNAPPAEPGLAQSDGTLVADQYLVFVTSLMSRIAGVLGLVNDVRFYMEEHFKLKQVFQDKYMAKSGLIVGDCQTPLALSIIFNLHWEHGQKKTAASRLARLVRYAKFKVSTGFAGTPVILEALTQTGYNQLAYRMLLEDGCPSWLYPVSKGATTIWERWDSMLEDGNINPGEMTSFNHYALGSVINWLHRHILGISPIEPGWKKVLVSPKPGGTITSAQGSFDSPNGTVGCSWQLSNDKIMQVQVTVPPNVRAVIAHPKGEVEVGCGSHTFEWDVKQDEAWPPQPLLTQFGL